MIKRRGAAHGLPGGGLPEHRRVLGARHRHVHDPRRHLHAPLRLLQRQDRQADLERPARAAARGALASPRWACATRSSRASTATTCPTTARPPSSASSARSACRRRTARSRCLTPDFRGEEMPLAKVIAERPDVFNHNVEVVPRLYPVARRGSRWERSLRVLRNAKEMGGDEVVTKSGLMVGLGETHDEMVEAFGDAARARRPGPHRRPVPAPDRAPPAGRALLAPGRVQGARGRGLRARLRPHRRRPARALELPRRPARPAGRSPASGPLAAAAG